MAECANGGWAAAGIVFAWDIVTRIIATELDANVATMGDIAWTDARSVQHDDHVATRLGTLHAAGHDMLTILDRRGALRAVVTLDELLRARRGGE